MAFSRELFSQKIFTANVRLDSKYPSTPPLRTYLFYSPPILHFASPTLLFNIKRNVLLGSYIIFNLFITATLFKRSLKTLHQCLSFQLLVGRFHI